MVLPRVASSVPVLRAAQKCLRARFVDLSPLGEAQKNANIIGITTPEEILFHILSNSYVFFVHMWKEYDKSPTRCLVALYEQPYVRVNKSDIRIS